MRELFQVHSVAREYRGRRDVTFHWFITNRDGKPSVPYSEAITNYQAGNLYAEGAIEEMFTREQADLLVAYLKNYPSTEHVEPAGLPIPDNRAGYGAAAVGGPTDFYMLADTEGYDLPFSVWGFFDLSRSEAVAGEAI